MLAKAITNYYCRKNIIEENKREIYCYGFQLIIADIINFTIIIVLGIILNKVSDSITFLITLCGLRQFCGGFHAKTFAVCRISFIATYIIVMVISFLLANTGIILIALINTVCFIFISCFSPIEHPNKPLTISQKKNNKIKSIITSAVLSIASIILVALDIQVGVTISITLCAVAVLMLVSLIMGKGGEKNV